MSEALPLARKLVALLEEAEKQRGKDEAHRSNLLADAYIILQGDWNWHDLVPHRERTDELRNHLPTGYAWCVLKQENDFRSGEKRVWPSMAFPQRETAEAWREFLEDYYYNVRIADGSERWLVEWTEATAINLAKGRLKAEKPVGHGYERGRSPWIGTLPMRVFKWDTENSGWRRMITTPATERSSS